jgi:hypothetical protein
VSAAKNRKPPTFFSPIGPIILFVDMITSFLTYPANAGDRTSAKCVLVPGQLLSAPYPNYINLNTLSGESSWHTDRETGMPEDGRLDHLLLKVL